MSHWTRIVLPLLALGIVSCQGGGGSTRIPAGGGFDIGPLLQTARHAAATDILNGVDFDATGGTTTVNGSSLIIDGTPPPLPPAPGFSWARYAFNVPSGQVVNTVQLDVQDVSSMYWVAYSDYSRGAWEWHGPYTDDAAPQFNRFNENYFSPSRDFYWVVLSPYRHKVQLNSTTVDYSPLPLMLGPQDESQIVAGDCLSPSLEHLPEIAPSIVRGAPVVAYIELAGAAPKLYLAFSSKGRWRKIALQPEHDFALPKLKWLGAEGILVAYDMTDGALLDMRLDPQLHVTGTQTIMAGPGLPLASISMDATPGGEIGIAHGYTDDTSGQLYYSNYDGAAWHNSADLHDGDPVGSLSFRYDLLDGDPWLLYTHGTVDTSQTIIIRSYMEEGRLTAGDWVFNSVPYADSPVMVDLDFKADGTPQMVFVAARDYTISFPVDFSASLLFDVVAGVNNGGTWEMTELFHSTLTPHLALPDSVILDMALASEAHWAQTDELLYSTLSGSITLDIATLQPTDGALLPDVQYMRDTGSGLHDDDVHFSGSPGRSFSWDVGWDGFGAYGEAAYLLSSPVAAQDVFNGALGAASDLMFWRWFYAIP